MPFDPLREDIGRLQTTFLEERGYTTFDIPEELNQEFQNKFENDIETLLSNDEDRAYHLVNQATSLIDYQIPFVDDDKELTKLEKQAYDLLSQAIKIDPNCFDARRILELTKANTLEEHYRFLIDGFEEVEEFCIKRASVLMEQDNVTDLEFMKIMIALRPYYRWSAQTIQRAFLTGRYRKAADLTFDMFTVDHDDDCENRFIAYLALAQLEELPILERLIETMQPKAVGRHCLDAWAELALGSIEYRQRNYAGAREHINNILNAYELPGLALWRQHQVPLGVFSRMCALPYSENELLIAISEAMPLLLEGSGFGQRPCFGSWIANLEEVQLSAAENPHTEFIWDDEDGGDDYVD